MALAISRRKIPLIVALAFPVVVAATLARNAWSIYAVVGDASHGVQGRYVFGGLVAVSTCVATAAAWSSRHARHSRIPMAALVVAAALAVHLAGWLWVIVRLWVPSDDGWGAAQRAAVDALDTGSLYPLLSVSLAVLALASVIAVARLASVEHERWSGRTGLPSPREAP